MIKSKSLILKKSFFALLKPFQIPQIPFQSHSHSTIAQNVLQRLIRQHVPAINSWRRLPNSNAAAFHAAVVIRIATTAALSASSRKARESEKAKGAERVRVNIDNRRRKRQTHRERGEPA